jgi:pimeloyl-ACP methyl ester carboxylesterase
MRMQKKSPGTPASYEFATKVRPEERDRRLERQGIWPPAVPPESWRRTRYGMQRKISAIEGKRSPVPVALDELLLRFPSAPIHGLQRLHEHHMELGPSENFHTFRVLRSAAARDRRKPISRIFLMHTGLNESNTMGLYYRLASQLISQDPSTVCIVRPFPGHLTRYPFQAFSEKPLDLYLWDGSHLFRQFMRFMIETRWFLSAIVRRSSYRCASGADLLAESDDETESRLDPDKLAAAIRDDWRSLHGASVATAEAEEKAREEEESEWNGGGQPRPPVNRVPVYQRQISSSIRGLRAALRLDRFERATGELTATKGPPEPSVHVIGYSLGGFTAQSVFMSWPFVVSSCSTMLAGGALRELAPTGFADPEEWQTVLHSLRYELDNRMMGMEPGNNEAHIGGIDTDLFTYFTRTFYEVFQQEYRGSIQTRYEAFGDRMFFIVGGDDPVMRPESVLQSGPKGGMNLLEVGGLGHFLQDGSSGSVGDQRQTFWIPEMSTLIHRFSENAAEQHQAQRELTWFDKKMRKPKLSRAEWQRLTDPERAKGSPGRDPDESLVRRLSPAEWVKIEQDGALYGEIFERCLDDLLHRIWKEKDGVLFVLRNEVPTVLLPPEAIRETAAGLYHDDYNIVRYCHGIGARRKVLEESIDRLCLVLPWNARSIMSRMDAQRAFPSQAESAGGRNRKRSLPDVEVWQRALQNCVELSNRKKGHESIRRFNGNDSQEALVLAVEGDSDHRLEKLASVMGDFTRSDEIEPVSSLPDSWIWLSSEALSLKRGRKVDLRRAIDSLIDFTLDHVKVERDEGKNRSSAPTREEGSMLTEIRNENVRLLNVSRARYNPRFRGRLMVDEKAARKSLLHAALCVALSKSIHGQSKKDLFT